MPLVPRAKQQFQQMDKFPFELEKGSRRHVCPSCGKRALKAYIDTGTGEYLPEQYGRCNRESKCTYHLNPYLDGYANTTPANWKRRPTNPNPQPPPKPVFFDFETFKQTLQAERYQGNTFVQNLITRGKFPFDKDEVTKVVQMYRLGTVANGYRAGATTFPFIDALGNIRAIQVKQFNDENSTTGTDFLHSIIEKYHTQNNEAVPGWLVEYISQDKRVSCLFGEHLLKMYPNNPVGLVEAPKTAIYGALYFGLPTTEKELVWVAVYNKSSFSFDKIKALKGRLVSVFPDLSKDGGTFKQWETKAKEYESRLPGTRFIFSDLLEKGANTEERANGSDLADFLIKYDWREFRKQEPPSPEPVNITYTPPPVTRIQKVDTQQLFPISRKIKDLPPVTRIQKVEAQPVRRQNTRPQSWDKDIEELESYFSSIEIPTQPVKLNNWSLIQNCPAFIEGHLTTIKANSGKQSFLPYLNRLQDLKQILR